MSRPRPTIHMDNVYHIGQPQILGSRKRKRSSTYSSEDDDAAITYPVPISPVKSLSPSAEDDSEADHRNKRARRALNIEHGMGGMSLNGHKGHTAILPASVANSTQHRFPPRSSLDYLNVHNVSEQDHLEIDENFGFRDDHLDGGDDLEVVMPNVEEATSPSVRIVKGFSRMLNHQQPEDNDATMRTSSWYEPEKDRIVVTDLSDSETEPDEGEKSAAELWPGDHNQKSQSSYIVSPAYFQRFGAVPKLSLPSAEPENSMALVAYRPRPYLSVQISRPDEVEEVDSTPVERKDDGDAMDIDY